MRRGVVIIAAVLAACSSGGGGSGSASGTVAAVPPQEAPAPAPSGTTPQPASSTATTFSGSTLGLPPIEASSTDSTVIFNAGTVTLAISTGGILYMHTFSSAVTATSGPLSGYAMAGFTASDPDDGLVYDANLSDTEFGMWQHDNDATGASGLVGAFATGTLTPPGSVPTTGSATYSGAAIGALGTPGQSYVLIGSADLAVNFAALTVTGHLDYNATPDGGTTVLPWADVGVNATFAPRSNGFAGTVAVPAVSGTITTPAMMGPVVGNFYGPSAGTLAGVWNASGSGTTALGAFGAAR